MKPNFLNVDTFRRSLDGMTITELHATYEALAASVEPIRGVSDQDRCKATEGTPNSAGEALDRYVCQIHECLEAVVASLETLTPKTGNEKNQKAHTLLHYGVLCFCDLEDIEELVGRLKRDCGFGISNDQSPSQPAGRDGMNTAVDMPAFERNIASANIIQLASVYDALMAVSVPVTSIAQQVRRTGPECRRNNAGDMLDELDEQIDNCVAAVIQRLNNSDAQCFLEEHELVRVLLSDQIQCGENLEHIASFGANLAVECGYNKVRISGNRSAAE